MLNRILKVLVCSESCIGLEKWWSKIKCATSEASVHKSIISSTANYT